MRQYLLPSNHVRERCRERQLREACWLVILSSFAFIVTVLYNYFC